VASAPEPGAVLAAAAPHGMRAQSGGPVLAGHFVAWLARRIGGRPAAGQRSAQPQGQLPSSGQAWLMRLPGRLAGPAVPAADTGVKCLTAFCNRQPALSTAKLRSPLVAR